MNKNLQKTTDPCKYPDNSFKLEVVGAFDRNILEREEKKSKAPLFESCFPWPKDYRQITAWSCRPAIAATSVAQHTKEHC